MISDAQFNRLEGRVGELENALSISDGKLILSFEGTTIQLTKFGIRIECGEFVLKTSNTIAIKGGGHVSIKGSKVDFN